MPLYAFSYEINYGGHTKVRKDIAYLNPKDAVFASCGGETEFIGTIINVAK